jgi:hypothetical protein
MPRRRDPSRLLPLRPRRRPAGRDGLLAAVQAKIPISPAPTDAIIGSLFHADSVMVRLGR